MTQPVLEARGLVKTFGHVIGLAGVDLQLYAGEVLAIIGDNGAGKSNDNQVPVGGDDPGRRHHAGQRPGNDLPQYPGGA